MASPSWDSSCSQSSPVSVFNSATCCFRVCKSHPTRIMSQPSVGVTSWYSPRPRLPATSGCSHDISERRLPYAAQAENKGSALTSKIGGLVLALALLAAPLGAADAQQGKVYR